MFVNALEGTLVLRKPLDYETLANFSVDIRAQVSNDSLNVNINSPKTLLMRFNVFFFFLLTGPGQSAQIIDYNPLC